MTHQQLSSGCHWGRRREGWGAHGERVLAALQRHHRARKNAGCRSVLCHVLGPRKKKREILSDYIGTFQREAWQENKADTEQNSNKNFSLFCVSFFVLLVLLFYITVICPTWIGVLCRMALMIWSNKALIPQYYNGNFDHIFNESYVSIPAEPCCRVH